MEFVSSGKKLAGVDAKNYVVEVPRILSYGV
jgi:hypothetical protein